VGFQATCRLGVRAQHVEYEEGEEEGEVRMEDDGTD
jgi:hypothetical protein